MSSNSNATYDPLCPQPNNLPSPGAPPPSPAFVLITTSPEQMVLCFAVTDVRSPPIACLGISWLARAAPGVFIISLLHLREERAAATKRRNIGVTITSRSGAAAAHASHCSAHHVSLGGTDRTHRRQIAASSRQLSLRDSPLAQRRYLSFIDAYVWIKNPCARGGKKTGWTFKGEDRTH